MTTAELLSKKVRENERTAADQPSSVSSSSATRSNPFLKRPDNPEALIYKFLIQSRADARKNAPQGKLPATRPYVEIEARIGIIRSPYGLRDMRVASGGAKRVPARGGGTAVATAFCVTAGDEDVGGGTRPTFEGGITRTHFANWTSSGLSEPSPITEAFHVRGTKSQDIREELVEVESVETVYGGYDDDNRVAFPGLHRVKDGAVTHAGRMGRMERKAKITGMDVALTTAPYDLRLQLATERILDNAVREPPRGWSTKRIKRRRSYSRRDKSFGWRMDVTEVTAAETAVVTGSTDVSYEIELELSASETLRLINLEDKVEIQKLCRQLAQQAWWMLDKINPAHDVLDVEECLRDHPDRNATRLALAQCGALKKFAESDGRSWESPIASSGPSPTPPASLCNIKFMGCMPVNFQRHNIDEVQRSEENGYFCSEKTDGVRYLMVFTGNTVVLVDRSMKGKQPKPVKHAQSPREPEGDEDPMAPIIPLFQPGTVLDGEVVMNRKYKRPVFIVFDVLASSSERPILRRPFLERLNHLKQSSFRTANCRKDIFDPSAVADPSVALPLVRKNFVKRTELDSLLNNVIEERGLRVYKPKSSDVHCHLTDGIIFQPNLPYVCSTDMNLLKWKYLDTVTIDVEILPNEIGFSHRRSDDDDEDVLRVGVVAEEGVMVEMTRFVKLPLPERRRLEADRHESNAKVVELCFDPTTGEWRYHTMRPDKPVSNHISTVMGTLLELAESLSTDELRYRMSVPPGMRDDYRRDCRHMQKQMLKHHREKIKATQQAVVSPNGRQHHSNGH